jgi:hypothetical protein
VVFACARKVLSLSTSARSRSICCLRVGRLPVALHPLEALLELDARVSVGLIAVEGGMLAARARVFISQLPSGGDLAAQETVDRGADAAVVRHYRVRRFIGVQAALHQRLGVALEHQRDSPAADSWLCSDSMMASPARSMPPPPRRLQDDPIAGMRDRGQHRGRRSAPRQALRDGDQVRAFGRPDHA